MAITRTNAFGDKIDYTKNERFKKLLVVLKEQGKIYNDTDFAIKIDNSKPYVSELKNKKRNLTEQFVMSICEAFPEVNSSWLLTGEGSMLSDDDSSTPIEVENAPSSTGTFKYYYDMEATASIMGVFNNELNAPFSLISFPGYEGCVGFNVAGESMLPTAKPSDIVAILPTPVKTIVNGEIYLVITRDNQRMIKRVVKEDNGITCYSDNPNKVLYASQFIEAEEILHLFRVRGFISHSIVG